MQSRRRVGAWLAGAASVIALACAPAVLAQSAPVVSRPVVQATPGANAQRLSAALARIARDPRDYTALIDAGDAANVMGDPEAAAGFYRRAYAISPNNPRINAGLARALVLQGKPTEAIPLFAGAELAGASLDVTADRGLAYDLVGDPATAQKYYQTALARKDDDEVRRRLGISQAISGNAAAADATLMPLLRKQDKPAWRAHAFALAIAGKTKEAVDTVNAILPAPLAQSVTPYLRYMPRLTRAQQAAAVNLGQFPRASEIGRDDPAIAAYAPAVTRVAAADAALIPRGKPLGAGRSRIVSAIDAGGATLTSTQRRARDKAARLAQAEAVQAARVAPPEPRPAIDRDGDGELPPVASRPMTPAFAAAPTRAPVSSPAGGTRAATPVPSARSNVAQSARASSALRPTPASTRPPGPVSGSTAPAPARVATLTLPPASTRSEASPTPNASLPAASATAPAAAPTPGFDLARLASATKPESTPPASPPATLPTTSAAAPSSVSLDQVFADLGAPSRAPAPVAGAVDVRAIEPVKPAPPAEPEPAKLEADARNASKAEVVKNEAGKLAAKKAAAATLSGKKGANAKTEALEGAKADQKLADAGKGKKSDPKLADAKKAEAKKATPTHPSRIWVQIGVGRSVSAIAYDWRKFVKERAALFKGQQASTSDMGRTNRILVGPFTTQKAASAFVTQAKKADLDGAFIWNSPAGQVVDPLAAK